MENGNHIPHDIENPPPTIETSLSSDFEMGFRLGNEKAYKPQVVSIGLIHHGKEELKPMEEHKMIWKNEKNLHSCYAETIGFKNDEFVKIVLVDAAFIIEVMLRYSFQDQEYKHDWIFNKPWILQDIWHDLRLLENHLPFFLFFFFLSLKNFWTRSLLLMTRNDVRRINSSNIAYLINFLRSLYVPLSRRGGEIKTLTIPSMTKLHRTGVRFKVGLRKKLFDLQFSNGVLKIPKLTISDKTKLTFRKSLAFEQCQCT
ncbi:hypothetical protein UlMin_035518 [Ulmus minor]